MKTSLPTILAFSGVLLIAVACDEVEKNDNSADEILAGTGVSSEDFGSVGESSPASLSPTAMEGQWVEDDGWETSTFDFNSDGTLQMTQDEEGQIIQEEGQWALEGNVLLLQGSETDQEDGFTCTENYIETETVAIVDGTLYMGVFIRTSGSGDSLDGTWERFSGEQGSYDCGEYTGTGFEIMNFTLNITGDSFIETEEYRYSEDFEGESDSGEGTDTTEGVVATDGMIVTLLTEDASYTVPVDPGDPQTPEASLYTFMSLARVSDDVLVWIWVDEYTTPEEALDAQSLVRQ